MIWISRNSTVSRIVSRLDRGTVTDTRMDTQFVVTESGCVGLKGMSLPQRAKALISIAHPDFKEALIASAHEQGLFR